MYKLLKNFYGNFVVRTDENSVTTFAIDADNTDAKEFAKWLSEGGIPEAAVEGEEVSAEWITETIAKLGTE